MSGICGVINFDGCPVSVSDIEAMNLWQRQRGPHGNQVWAKDSAGFGLSLLAATPEAVDEQNPYVHADSDFVIVCDARLDYRDELIAILGSEIRSEAIGDAELILHAYLRWGEESTSHLLGDYAFAIWDSRKKTLFCARDPFGMRPFCYHHVPGERLVFASDPRAILLLTEVPYQINETRIADFLVMGLEWADYTSTFFEGIHRLPSASRLKADRGSLEIREHWAPAPGPLLTGSSDLDILEGFTETFRKAIECRLRAPARTVGSMLSGGMDSGSVAAFAKELINGKGEGPYRTYSLARPESAGDCAETRAIRSSQTMSHVLPTTVVADDAGSDFRRWLAGFEEPYDTEYNFLRALYVSAHDQGVRVVLDGGGGDTVLSVGTYIPRLIRQGRLALALREMRGEIEFWQDGSLPESILTYGRSALLPSFAKRAFRRLFSANPVKNFLESALISPELAARVNIRGRIDQYRSTFARDWTTDYALETCSAIRPNVTAGRERYGRIAAGCAVEPRDPFLDLRVIDYCSRLPGRFRLRDGWYKRILRDVTEGLLPDEVRWMRGKPHIGWAFSAAVNAAAIAAGQLERSSLAAELDGYVSQAALKDAWQAFDDGSDPDLLLSANSLAIWLRENSKRPVVKATAIG